MEPGSPLINPGIDDFDAKDEDNSKKKNKYHSNISEEQLKLNTNSFLLDIRQTLGRFMHFVKRRGDFMQTDYLWKSPALPFAIVSAIFLCTISFFVATVNFSNLPPELPFFYNNIDKHWYQVDKTLIVMFPVILMVIEFLILRFGIIVYRKDKRLGSTLSWVLTLNNLMMLIAVLQMFTLTLK